MSRVLLWVLLKGPDEKMGEAQPPLHENLQQSREDEAKTRITLPEGRCYGQSTGVPPNPYVEILTRSVMILGGGAFGRGRPYEWDCSLIKEGQEFSLASFCHVRLRLEPRK